MSNKNILIIGGDGFLGHHVVINLLKKKFNLTVIDKNFKNLDKIKTNKLFLIKKDLNHNFDISNILKKQDFVFNFAALADLNEALRKPVETIKTNILLNTKLLLECKKFKKIKKVIFASTVYVNGIHGGFYRCSKQAAESYIKEFYNIFGLKYTIVRYGSLYGVGSEKNNGFRKIVENAINNKKIIYNGPKETTREYINVIDAAENTSNLIDKKYDNKIVTITGNHKIKMEDLLKLIAEILNINEKKIIFSKKKHFGHYIRTPYSYDGNTSFKVTNRSYIEISEGIKQLIDFIKEGKK